MISLESAGILFLLCVGLALFVRFLAVGIRARDTTTLLIAFATLVGVAALTLLGLAFDTLAEDPVRSRWLALGAVSCATLCVASNVAMTAVLFHAGSRFGWFVSGFFVAAMLTSVVGIATEGGVDLRRTPSGWMMGNSILLLGTLYWGSLEAAVTWRFLRRQIPLGITSEHVVRRVGFFSLASGLTAVAGTIIVAVLTLGLQPGGQSLALSLGALGLCAGLALLRSYGSAERARRKESEEGC